MPILPVDIFPWTGGPSRVFAFALRDQYWKKTEEFVKPLLIQPVQSWPVGFPPIPPDPGQWEIHIEVFGVGDEGDKLVYAKDERFPNVKTRDEWWIEYHRAVRSAMGMPNRRGKSPPGSVELTRITWLP